MESGRVAVWLKKPGEAFRRGEAIVEIETDKTVVELPALDDGVLIEILARAGDRLNVGEPLCHYRSAEAGAEEQQGTVTSTTSKQACPVMPAAVLPDRPRATPRARAIARRNGIDLGTVNGSGRRARIEARDVEALLAARPGVPTEPPTAPSPDLAFCELPTGRIAYRVWGSTGPRPVLLLHGFGGDGQTWALFARDLARRGRRVLALDLPAHGATTVAAGGVAEIVDAVSAFVERVGLEGVQIVGHSLGAVAAARLAARSGTGVGSVTLIAPAGMGSAIDADFIDAMARVHTGGGLAHLLRRIALRPPVLSSAQLDALAASIRGRLKEIAHSIVRDGCQQVDIVSDIAACAHPIRIVWGLEDRIIPWTQATGAGSGVPVHFIADAGHMPHWDQPQRLAALFD
jgi:pyruvate dehydrogenase E2 component (dihydrolipoamide acetyltransferase)